MLSGLGEPVVPGPFVLPVFLLYFYLCFSAIYGWTETLRVATSTDPKYDRITSHIYTYIPP